MTSPLKHLFSKTKSKLDIKEKAFLTKSKHKGNRNMKYSIYK